MLSMAKPHSRYAKSKLHHATCSGPAARAQTQNGAGRLSYASYRQRATHLTGSNTEYPMKISDFRLCANLKKTGAALCENVPGWLDVRRPSMYHDDAYVRKSLWPLADAPREGKLEKPGGYASVFRCLMASQALSLLPIRYGVGAPADRPAPKCAHTSLLYGYVRLNQRNSYTVNPVLTRRSEDPRFMLTTTLWLLGGCLPGRVLAPAASHAGAGYTWTPGTIQASYRRTALARLAVSPTHRLHTPVYPLRPC